ncbi:MAG: PspC domain-containing protein [Calditrichaeota bacterium]|nr:PspC domain-containing protein [Calditrichota bacterium]MCB9366564.1 PspC domain-containing protein [Calditrichota bacterium]MCB9391178.1 PspC domain-containing protein [Calditrichota bacterium]
MNETSNQVKRLRRSASEKKIAGICGGFGQYFNVDPTLVRVLWVLGALLAFASVFLYLILWVVMPLDGDPDIVTPRG